MKKDNKVNALKVFNDNRAMAYKKAGGAMKDFKKSLPKAQDGRIGPMTKAESKMRDLVNPQPPIPQAPRSSSYDNYNAVNKDMLNKAEGTRDRLLNQINTAPKPNMSKAAAIEKYKNIVNTSAKPSQKKGGSVRTKKK